MFDNLFGLTTLAAEASGGAAASGAGPMSLLLVPLLPLLGSILCGVLWFRRSEAKTKLPAWITVASIAGAFAVVLSGFLAWQGGDRAAQVFTAFQWIHFDVGAGVLDADFAFHMDGLSWLWMLFVTGLGSLIALYASEYMAGDKGYPRFFAYFALFVFSMACLVMADNLVLLYLGWEGVGLCSYLLIGYFNQKPSAVAAAKKAFIVNRIGDLGLALGVFLTFVTFQTVQYDELFAMIGHDVAADGRQLSGMWQAWAIPLLLTLGAFGKSAQLPLYVWLPDAMEGPTPVSALIHAATMVTAGVYLIARMFPLFALPGAPHYALEVVAWTGALTALLAATIGMAQFDIKRIMAYSTVSQLGYMFAGLGVLTTVGGVYHVVTHAFFKAALFLACGAVMHGFAGQLDLRKLSGLRHMKGWGIVTLAMFVGCLNLAGFPVITSGYFSKDMILAESFVTPGYLWIGIILLFTAGLTAYYTFRVYFRVFEGPAEFEPGDEHHEPDELAEEEAAANPAEAPAHAEERGAGHAGARHGHGFHPHPPGWAINVVLATLAVLATGAIGLYFVDKDHHGYVGGLLHDSSAHYVSPYGHHGEGHSGVGLPTEVAQSGTVQERRHGEAVAIIPVVEASHGAGEHSGDHADHGEAGTLFGFDPHKAMYFVSAVVGFIGIAIAAFLHGPVGIGGLFLGSRTEAATSRADALAAKLGPIPRWAQNKWYVDEFYDYIIRIPLIVIAHLSSIIDKLLVDGLVEGVARIPKLMGESARRAQTGVLQGYAASMAGGVGVILLVVLLVVLR